MLLRPEELICQHFAVGEMTLKLGIGFGDTTVGTPQWESGLRTAFSSVMMVIIVPCPNYVFVLKGIAESV